MKSLLVAVIFSLVVLLTAPASATLIFDESFDYANDAALDAAWAASGTSNPTYFLDTAFGNTQPSYKMPNLTATNTNRLAYNLGADYNPTSDAQPLDFSIDIYMPVDGSSSTTLWTGARLYVELRGYSGNAYGSGSLQTIVGLGLNNTSTDFFSNRYFQARVGTTSTFYTLDAQLSSSGTYRTTGWHTLKASIKASTIDFYLDNVLAETITRPNTYGFDSLLLGSGYTSGGWDFWTDNINISMLPEPATLIILGIGALLLRRKG